MNVVYCDTDRPRVPRWLSAAVRDQMDGHDAPQVVREHGQWWVKCSACGFLASAGGAGDFEQIDLGDESCPATGGGDS